MGTKKTMIQAVVVAAGLAAAGCATPMGMRGGEERKSQAVIQPMKGSNASPAGQGTVAVARGASGNTALTVRVQHAAFFVSLGWGFEHRRPMDKRKLLVALREETLPRIEGARAALRAAQDSSDAKHLGVVHELCHRAAGTGAVAGVPVVSRLGAIGEAVSQLALEGDAKVTPRLISALRSRQADSGSSSRPSARRGSWHDEDLQHCSPLSQSALCASITRASSASSARFSSSSRTSPAS